MRSLLNYVLVIAVCTFVGCSSDSPDEETAAPLQTILKIGVAADGTITLDGNVTSLEKLRDVLEAAVGTEPAVWLYRAESEGDPPEESSLVLRAIMEKLFPISHSSEPDFSTIMMRDGTVIPRD